VDESPIKRGHFVPGDDDRPAGFNVAHEAVVHTALIGQVLGGQRSSYAAIRDKRRGHLEVHATSNDINELR
jgi:hypothetical protein